MTRSDSLAGALAPELYRGGVGFFEQLRQSWAMSNSMLCVGLDPDPQRLPDGFGTSADAVFAFCREIVDATADVVCAFKPQVAYFASQGAEDALERICAYIRESYPDVTLVLDSKRGDIGSTAEHYAREALVRYGAHAATVNPYMGADSIAPYLELGGGVIVVCRTSNASADVIQSMDTGGKPLYVRVAELVADRWAQLGDCGLVVGATYPDELRIVRDIVGDLPILVPGVGVQGGDPRAAVAAGTTSDGRGLLISASRSVIYASSGRDFAEAARREAIDTRLQALPAGW